MKRKEMKDQSDFWLFSHQVCLEAKQLEGKRQIILRVNNERISHQKEETKKQRMKNKLFPHPPSLSHIQNHLSLPPLEVPATTKS